MKTLVSLLAGVVIFAPAAHAETTQTYCGRIECGGSLDGCLVRDNHLNPLVTDRGNKLTLTKMSAGLGPIEENNTDDACVCIVGHVVPDPLDTDAGPSERISSARFTYVKSIHKIDEAKCASAGL